MAGAQGGRKGGKRGREGAKGAQGGLFLLQNCDPLNKIISPSSFFSYSANTINSLKSVLINDTHCTRLT